MSRFQALPPEIHASIQQYLSDRDISSLYATCRRLCHVTSRAHLTIPVILQIDDNTFADPSSFEVFTSHPFLKQQTSWIIRYSQTAKKARSLFSTQLSWYFLPNAVMTKYAFFLPPSTTRISISREPRSHGDTFLYDFLHSLPSRCPLVWEISLQLGLGGNLLMGSLPIQNFSFLQRLNLDLEYSILASPGWWTFPNSITHLCLRFRSDKVLLLLLVGTLDAIFPLEKLEKLEIRGCYPYLMWDVLNALERIGGGVLRHLHLTGSMISPRAVENSFLVNVISETIGRIVEQEDLPPLESLHLSINLDWGVRRLMQNLHQAFAPTLRALHVGCLMNDLVPVLESWPHLEELGMDRLLVVDASSYADPNCDPHFPSVHTLILRDVDLVDNELPQIRQLFPKLRHLTLQGTVHPRLCHWLISPDLDTLDISSLNSPTFWQLSSTLSEVSINSLTVKNLGCDDPVYTAWRDKFFLDHRGIRHVHMYA